MLALHTHMKTAACSEREHGDCAPDHLAKDVRYSNKNYEYSDQTNACEDSTKREDGDSGVDSGLEDMRHEVSPVDKIENKEIADESCEKAIKLEDFDVVIYQDQQSSEINISCVDCHVTANLMKRDDICVLARTEGDVTILTPNIKRSEDIGKKKTSSNTPEKVSEKSYSACDQKEYKSPKRRVNFRTPKTDRTASPRQESKAKSSSSKHGKSRSSENLSPRNFGNGLRDTFSRSPTKRNLECKQRLRFSEQRNDFENTTRNGNGSPKSKYSSCNDYGQVNKNNSQNDQTRGDINKLTILKKGSELEQLFKAKEYVQSRGQNDDVDESGFELEVLKHSFDGDKGEIRSSVQVNRTQNVIKFVRSKCANVGNNKVLNERTLDNSPNKNGAKIDENQTKKRKKPSRKPRTEQEVLQRQIETGQLRSKVSRYKTEGLRNIRILELIGTGFFGNKYKVRILNK